MLALAKKKNPQKRQGGEDFLLQNAFNKILKFLYRWQRHLTIVRIEVYGLWLPLETKLGHGPWGGRVSRCFSVHTFPQMGPQAPFDVPIMICLLLVASVASSLT